MKKTIIALTAMLVELLTGILMPQPSHARIAHITVESEGNGSSAKAAIYDALTQAIGQVNGSDRLPAVFYFHPWELDPDQPRVSGINRRTRFRHYLNLSRFESRLGALLDRFSWGRMDKVFGIGS